MTAQVWIKQIEELMRRKRNDLALEVCLREQRRIRPPFLAVANTGFGGTLLRGLWARLRRLTQVDAPLDWMCLEDARICILLAGGDLDAALFASASLVMAAHSLYAYRDLRVSLVTRWAAHALERKAYVLRVLGRLEEARAALKTAIRVSERHESEYRRLTRLLTALDAPVRAA